jgi:hypothetical protein
VVTLLKLRQMYDVYISERNQKRLLYESFTVGSLGGRGLVRLAKALVHLGMAA